MNRSIFLSGLRCCVLAFAFLFFVSNDASAQRVGEACSTLTSAPRGLWCDPIPGTCGILGIGTLVRSPQICGRPQSNVCGCDGVTYFDDCSRTNAKVAKLADMACLGFTGKPKR